MKLDDKIDICGMNVLIIDDNSENLQVIGNILKDLNLKLSFSMSAPQALESILYNPPDLILSDVKMPTMSGFELCKILRNNPNTSNIPIIFITAQKTDDKSLLEGFTLGAVDYVKKPINSEELIARLHNHLYLKAYRNYLESMIREKNRMFSIFVHDIKNPFSALLGIAELSIFQKEKISKEKLLQNMDVIYSSGKKIINLLEDLEYTIGSNTTLITVNFEKILLNNLFEKASIIFQQSILEKRINLKIQSDQYFVTADRFMLETVIRNAINNSIKYTNIDGSIYISAQRENDRITISIEDTGIGMDETTLKNLLENNINTSTKGTADEKGTGLGVGICKELIKRNKGEFYISSKLGVGTKVSFSLLEAN